MFTVVHHCINHLGCDVAHLWVMARETLFLLALFTFFFNSMGYGNSEIQCLGQQAALFLLGADQPLSNAMSWM